MKSEFDNMWVMARCQLYQAVIFARTAELGAFHV